MIRKASGCVVFRLNAKHEVEILLVRSTNSGKWVFPKGGVEKNLSSQESALKEVYEEAGVTGVIEYKLGKYQYMKEGVLQKVKMYSCRYTHDTPDWPEQHIRERRWMSAEKAMRKLSARLRPYLEATLQTIEVKGH